MKRNTDIALRKLKLTEVAAVNRRKFQNEALQLIKIVHPNIVQCYGIILEERTFVLECCEQMVNDCGEMVVIHSLLGLINTMEDSIQPYTKLKAIHDISNGLAYLHSRNVIAGDLKLSNILVSEGWLFKIADFSVETAHRHNLAMLSTTYSNQNNELTYTLYYLAPELMGSNITNCNKNSKTDIFSFAIMMFEIVFPGVEFRLHTTAVQHMEAVKLNWRPPIPSNSVCDSLEPMIDVMTKCWNDNPTVRMEAAEINLKIRKPLRNVCIILFTIKGVVRWIYNIEIRIPRLKITPESQFCLYKNVRQLP